jgi:MOSC domain-containing protein YiiM
MTQVISLHRGKSEPLPAKPGTKSAIRKVSIPGPVAIDENGIAGDEHVHLKYHGGPFKALCFYASEYYPAWNAHTVEAMPPGSFGENVHTAGLLDEEVCLGDVLRMGTAAVEVTGPRGPCNNLAAHWGIPKLHLWSKDQRRTGFYVRVVTPGVVEVGDSISVEARPLPRCTLPAFWDIFEGVVRDAQLTRVMLEIPALDPACRPTLLRQLEAARK